MGVKIQKLVLVQMLLALATSTCPSVKQSFSPFFQHLISLKLISQVPFFLDTVFRSFVKSLCSSWDIFVVSFHPPRKFVWSLSLSLSHSLSIIVWHSTQLQNLFYRIFNLLDLFYLLKWQCEIEFDARGKSKHSWDARESPSMPLRCPWANAPSCSFMLLSGFHSLLSFHFYFWQVYW